MSSKVSGAATSKQDRKDLLLPKLRFPEFRGALGWELWPLKKLAKRRTRKNAGGQVDRVLTNSAEHGVVDQRDYFEKDIANLANLEGYFIIEKGDYVYNPRVSNLAPVGPIHKNEIGLGVMSPLYTVFAFDSTKNDFYAHYFKTPHWHNYMRQVSNSGARHDRMAISADDFINMPVPVSHPLEQQKIADCLSSIDTLIAAEVDKMEALKDHKKGLMHQILPAPGETTPRLRLPEFQHAGEWEHKKLGPSTIKVGSGITPKGGNAVYSPTGRPFMRSQNVGWGELLLEGLAFIDEKLHAIFPATEIRVNDVLLNITGASIGRSAIADNRISGGNVNQHVCIIRLKSKEIVPSYLNQFLLSPFGQSQIDSFQAGGNRQGLNFEQIRSFEVPYPPTLHEQQRIADCLRSIDTLVTLQGDRITAMEAHRRGLMQRLFPVSGEVSV